MEVSKHWITLEVVVTGGKGCLVIIIPKVSSVHTLVDFILLKVHYIRPYLMRRLALIKSEPTPKP